jgi:hypothetical protein
VLGPEAPRGPGGSFDSLTWVGYASLVAAFGFLVFGLRPLTEMGDPRLWNWEQVPALVVDALRDVAVLVLPAALEFGVPGARRVTPWLMRGTVLLALEVLLRPLVRAGRSAVLEGQMMSESMSISYADPAWIALTLCSIALTIVGIAGAWSLSDGLADAGGRPARRLLVALVVAGTLLGGVIYVPMLGIDTAQEVGASEIVLLVSNLTSSLLGFLDNMLWLVIGARLIAGLVARRWPRTAWVFGALAGDTVIALRLGSPLLFGLMTLDPWVGYTFLFSGTAGWVLLAIALALGLGRGRSRRRGRPRRLRRFVLSPTS